MYIYTYVCIWRLEVPLTTQPALPSSRGAFEKTAVSFNSSSVRVFVQIFVRRSILLISTTSI